jgi:hypothetical protein
MPEIDTLNDLLQQQAGTIIKAHGAGLTSNEEAVIHVVELAHSFAKQFVQLVFAASDTPEGNE